MGKVYTPDPIASETGFKLTLNNNLDAIETALEDVLSRSGATPNQMSADIDMNSNDILNVNRIDAHEYYQDGEPLDSNSVLEEAKAYTDAAVADAGDVSGPVSSQDQEIALFDGVSGDTLQSSGVFIDTNGNIYGHGATVKEVDTATYTVQESDNGKIIHFRNSGGCTIDLPGSEEPYESNIQFIAVQWAANPITFQETLSSVIRARDDLLTSGGQYSVMSAYKHNSTDWVVIGGEA